jgi:hypothetical protein
MTPEAQRIAIAEACGTMKWSYALPIKIIACTVPDYLNDLNAMHEAERTCIIGKEELEERYWLALYDVCKTTRWPFDATAAQRAEAFLRTLNLWRDDA